MNTDSETIIDFITGETLPNTGSEANRQAVERFLVNEKGFLKEDIEVNVPIEITVAGEPYTSRIDLVASVNNTRFMAIKCAAGSLGSREREIVSAARLAESFQIPFSVVSDGKTAIVLDTVSGKKLGEGPDFVLSKKDAEEKFSDIELKPVPKERIEREKLVFRSYDSMNVNR